MHGFANPVTYIQYDGPIGKYTISILYDITMYFIMTDLVLHLLNPTNQAC